MCFDTAYPTPRLIRRSGTATGWLAVSPPEARWQIGVIGGTAEDAIRKFHVSWARWEETASAVDLLQAQRATGEETPDA